LNDEVENYTGDPDDYAARFVAGDVLHADKGKLLSFFNARAAAVASSDDIGSTWGGGKKTKSGNQNELAHYTCEVRADMPLPRESDGTLSFLKRESLFTPWETALRFMSEEEMAAEICQSYQDMPELLLAAFRTRPEWLPDFVKGNATVTGAAPAATNNSSSAQTTEQPPAADSQQGAGGPSWGKAATGESSSSSPDFVQEMTPENIGEAIPKVPVAPVPGADEAPAQTETPADTEPAVADAMARLSNLEGNPGSGAQ
jgi:hypothetical protein